MKRAHLLLPLICSVACGGGSTKPDPHAKPVTDTLYELDLTEPLPELGSEFLGTHKPGLHEALGRVHELAAEPLARGLFVRLGPMAGHYGDVDEWASAFEAFRKQKKPVHCHFDGIDNLGFALGSHCDTLVMTPAGSLDLVGLAVQTIHAEELLTRVGVKAELLQVGKYKGASEPLTRNAMSDELKQNLGELLDDFEANFAQHLATRTAREPAALRAVLDAGPFDAEDAITRKLVDTVAFDDEARAKAKAAASARNVVRLFPAREQTSLSLRSVLEALGEDDKKPEARPSLAVVYMLGDILDGQENGPDQVVSEPYIQKLRKLADDRDVRAVVLRIESPGGSALASDRLWHAVRRVASHKPVIVSLGDMAASGGYYIACAGTHVFASRGSIVGSIGVVGGKIVIGELGEKIGVHASTIARGAHAAWLSSVTPFSADERALLDRLLTRTYDRFVERVASGRKRTAESLAKATEGRVMGGTRAVELGLVDELGGLNEALEFARKQGKLPKDAPVQQWPDVSDPLRALASQFGVHALSATFGEGIVDQLKRGEVQQGLQAGIVRVLSAAPGTAAAALPFALQIR